MKTTAKTNSEKKSPVKKHVEKSSKETLEDIFQGLLKDIYWAEKHLLKALPKMIPLSIFKILY